MHAPRFALAVAAIASLALVSPAANASTVTGLLSGGGVVWVDDGSAPAPVSAEMRNASKAFVPDLLVVPVGSTVRFPNDDPFFHSIFSVSAPNDFDIGFYSTGPGKVETFSTQGIVDVRCHIHVFMRGTIVVVSGPYEKVDGDAFALDGVRPGDHVAYGWNIKDGLRTEKVRVPRDGSVALAKPL